MKNKDEYTHILKYTGMFGGVQGLSILITLVRNKFVALLLGPAGMGLVSLFNTALNFFSQATNLGISFSAVRHLSEIFERGDEARITHFIKVVRGWSLLTALVGMLVFAMLGPLLCSSVFSGGGHAWEFLCLSPIVAMTAVTGGETAILKGARRLKSLAVAQVLTMVSTLLISVPVYYFLGMRGIVPVLVALSLITLLLTMHYSCRYYPYTLHGTKGVLGEGMEMVRLGVAFVAAGILGSGAEMVIRYYLNVRADLDVVGLYNAGYMLTITYAGMVFSAMETDYFPRLSSVSSDFVAMTDMANQQIEVSLLLISPMLAILIVFLPLLLPLLYSRCFMDVVSMGQVAVFSMYFKAITLPIEYINLARGDSGSYLLLEASFDVLMMVLIVFGYRQFGLWGTGLALSVTHLLNVLMVIGYARWRYHYSMSRSVVRYMSLQYPLGLLAYGVTFLSSVWAYWVAGILIIAVSVGISLYIIIYKKTSVWDALKQKIHSHG